MVVHGSLRSIMCTARCRDMNAACQAAMPTAGSPVEIAEFDSTAPGGSQVEHGIFVIEMLIN